MPDLKEIEESHRKENGKLRERVKELEEENKSKQKAYDDCYCEYKRVLKENEQLKEYILIAPNLDEMTATKYRNIQQDAYIQGRAEEQQKAEQIIYESYISKQIIKDKIEEYDKQRIKMEKDDIGVWFTLGKEWSDLKAKIEVLQELLREEWNTWE